MALDENLIATALALCIGLFFAFTLKRQHFFTLPYGRFWGRQITFGEVLGVFAVYFALAFCINPFFMFLASHFSPALPPASTQEVMDWWQIGFVVFMTVVVLLYSAIVLRKRVFYLFWGPGHRPKPVLLKESFKAALKALVLSALLMIFLGQLANMLMKEIWGIEPTDQLAIQYIKGVQEPALLFVCILVMIFIVPLIEELIFRGFLQSWLSEKLGTAKAIFIASLIFACCHYAPEQGWSNISIIVSIFAFALLLGFVYERQQTLWASFFTHLLFNAFGLTAALLL